MTAGFKFWSTAFFLQINLTIDKHVNTHKMRAKHYASFAVLLILINICSAVYHFKSTNADVTISGTTYKGTTVYADLDQNAQQIIYPFSSNTITETEMYNTVSTFFLCQIF